jgi:hypothetical protein
MAPDSVDNDWREEMSDLYQIEPETIDNASTPVKDGGIVRLSPAILKFIDEKNEASTSPFELLCC